MLRRGIRRRDTLDAAPTMMGHDVDPKVLQQIRELLLAACDRVVEMERRDALATWRAWTEAFPLMPKQHRAILEDTVARMRKVHTGLFGRSAIQEYKSLPGFGVIVLCEGALVAWSCTGRHVPSLDGLNAELVVTNLTFDWSFGIPANWHRDEPTYLDRDMLEREGLLGDQPVRP